MDLLFKHTQTKKDRRGPAQSICELKLFGDDNLFILDNYFDLDYHRYGTKKNVTFYHQITLDLINGDVNVLYKIVNDNLTDDNIYKTSQKSKKNNFNLLNDSIENGFYRGEKRLNYWGVKYSRATNEMVLIITNILKSKLSSDYYMKKSYKEKPSLNELYDMIVDFHLHKKNIKGHDNVYYDIMYLYPPKKYLKINDNKFLPSILDYLGIKSKFLIKELNILEYPININAVSNFCKLFGKNHLDYIKKFDWKFHCTDINVPKYKVEELKTEFEKNTVVKLINNWNKTRTNFEPFFLSLNKLLKLRSDLELNGYNFKMNIKNDDEFYNAVERLTNLKKFYQRGYKLKYSYPENFLDDIQQDITLNNETFKVKVLVTEEDFIFEGQKMKNCMPKQFDNGLLYIYLSGEIKNKRINLQYRKGNLVQSYGKSNTPTPNIFLPYIDILNEKFKKYKEIKWIKEKYGFINK